MIAVDELFKEVSNMDIYKASVANVMHRDCCLGQVVKVSGARQYFHLRKRYDGSKAV